MSGQVCVVLEEVYGVGESIVFVDVRDVIMLLLGVP